MQVRSFAAAALSLSMLAACVSHAPSPASAATGDATYIVVRHAEKTADPQDPALTAAGQARAAALARRFAAAPLTAAYATAFKRTQQTAQPAATAAGVPVATYDAKRPAAEFVAELRRAQPRGLVLVVGHSNTVPDIVAALCACAVAPLDDSTYDHLYEVRIDAGGHATLVQQTF